MPSPAQHRDSPRYNVRRQRNLKPPAQLTHGAFFIRIRFHYSLTKTQGYAAALASSKPKKGVSVSQSGDWREEPFFSKILEIKNITIAK
jgi:hypothetical protein